MMFIGLAILGVMFSNHAATPFVFNTISTQSSDLTQREQYLIDHVQQSIAKVESGYRVHKLALALPGMSSPKVRSLLNALCQMPHTRYFEIGVHKGSTFISALLGNRATVDDVLAIDCWITGFGNVENEFLSNCARLIRKYFRYLNKDAFTVNPKGLFSQPVTTYFYDGGHEAWQQKAAFTHFNEVFDDCFIALVDDWSWDYLREATFSGFSDLRYTVLFERALASEKDQDVDQWWNWLYVAVIRKPKTN